MIPAILATFSLCFATSCSAVGPFKHLVAFGDSYTDNVQVSNGGIPWPDYVNIYSEGAVSIHDFARAGGVCSNLLTPRVWPSVLESQIPRYDLDTLIKEDGSTYILIPNGTYLPLPSQDTLYSIWIGTNDVGADALLNKPREGISIVNTTACVFDWVKALYDKGARNFLIQNMIPLQLTPMYSATGYTTKYWPLPHNQTEWSILMSELVQSGNELWAVKTKYIAPLQFPGAVFGLFDSYGLFKDMYYNPASYLAGPPYFIDDPIVQCKYPYEGSTWPVCVVQPDGVRNSYLWWDEVHPSDKASQIVARHVLSAMNGQGPFVSWYGHGGPADLVMNIGNRMP
ncbi:carbohydrate esterase family 16 protein [Ceratobasidium sp. AG-Ba]|nr:carbohydrate esterase family 16 protein [Ceratobasidium sp. AG-Ba]